MKILTNTTKNFLLIFLVISFFFISNYSSIGVIDYSKLIIRGNIEEVEMPISFVPTQAQNSVWHDIGRELNLDHKVQNPAVQKAIKQILSDPQSFYKILESATPYLYYIYQQTKQKGLPVEIALIPFIESEYNPNDHSVKGALGLWQLMSVTAKELGVKIKNGYDGRRNIVASTQAALAYFKDLGNMFNGNWYLAMAAYNAGQGRIMLAEKKSGSHDYWQLPLPKETKLYVPKLLAVAAIIKNPKKYDIKLPVVKNNDYFTAVKSENAINLQKISEHADVDIDILKKLNPDYSKSIIPKSYSLLVPTRKLSVILNNVDGIKLTQ